MSKHQEIMNRAYDRYEMNMKREDFWAQLSEVEKLAVFTANLNYQVDNGGFAQWWDNGYHKQAGWLIDNLPKFELTMLDDVVRVLHTALARIEEWEPEVEEEWTEEYEDEETGEWIVESGTETVANSWPDFEDLNKQWYTGQGKWFMAAMERLFQDQSNIEKVMAGSRRRLEKEQDQVLVVPGKPTCTPADGNIFSVMGAAARALRRVGQGEAAKKMSKEMTECDNYHQAVGVATRYVDIQV